MERFVVNGAEVEFDPFDLDAMETYMAGVNRVDAERRVKQASESPIAQLRRACNAILDFFDDVLGEGKSEELFGTRVNVKTIFGGYCEFTTRVNACIQEYTKDISTAQAAAAAPPNRAQRRGKR